MAASVYATPPPDLSGEDTTLSDVSNSSQITNSSNSTHLQTTNKLLNNNKRTLSTSSSPSSTMITSPSLLHHANIYLNNPTTINLLSSSSSSDNTVPDPSKKRRKQSTPFRISATLTATPTTTTTAETVAIGLDQNNHRLHEDDGNDQSLLNEDEQISNNMVTDEEQHVIDGEGALPSRVLINDVIITSATVSNENKKKIGDRKISVHADDDDMRDDDRDKSYDHRNNHHDIENEITKKYDLKNLKQHTAAMLLSTCKSGIEKSGEYKMSVSDKSCEINDGHDSVSVKKEQIDSEKMSIEHESTDWNGNNSKLEKGEKLSLGMMNSSQMMGLGKPEDWLSLTGLPFPFTPEAAAALSASGYLPQLPLLGVPSMSHFSSVDGLSRSGAPPLRIFNPEAYCDLCNKEFCNKYFLKTHKANKHGIYEPPVSSTDIPTTSQINQITQMSQVFQLQQQMQQQSQSQSSSAPLSQNQSSSSSSSTMIPNEPSVFCDICFKRFTSVFSMRKHRVNKHEMPPSSSADNVGNKHSDSDDGECFAPFRMPEGFNQDFSREQEDVPFTPQPRKLSPSSVLQAREANFAYEKLKRLGVINPEAFCEICCKEYCNKYFLRTHKFKRHGIFIPPDDIKDEPVPQQRNPWHYVQTSPLNLMMGSLQQQHQAAQQLQISSLIQAPQGLRDRDDIKKSLPEKLDAEMLGKKLSEHQEEIEKLIDMTVESKMSKACDMDLDDNEIDMIKENEDHEMKSEQKTPHDTPPPSSQDSDAISVDLQKLQSMILQLNDLNSPRVFSCSVCGKDCENQYMLHAHMIADHSNLGDNNNGMKRSRSPSPTPSIGAQIEVCKHCEKEFTSFFTFKQHLFEMHGISSPSPKREGFLTPDRPIPGLAMPSTPTQGNRAPYTITPTSSYCEICNKELCNKYFMKTHMQRMHGIEIENGAQIGGVVCNICNKELCSKYFLRVHKHNTHGIVEEGSPLPQPRSNGEPVDLEMKFPPASLKAETQTTPPMKPQNLSNDRESDRYTNHYTEVCPICSRRFKYTKYLRAHLMNDHGKLGTDKLKEVEDRLNLSIPPSPTLKIPNGTFGLHSPESSSSAANQMMNKNALNDIKEYFCSYCQFSTPYLTYLFIHERNHMQQHNPLLSNQSESAVSLAKSEPSISERLFQPAASAASSSNNTPNSTPASTPIPQTPQDVAASNKIESGNILNELANLTQRPAIYALPQETGPMVMQSFLIEETSNHIKNEHLSSTSNSNRFVPAFVFFPVKERISTPITVSFTLTPA